jgi:hypothetical protein
VKEKSQHRKKHHYAIFYFRFHGGKITQFTFFFRFVGEKKTSKRGSIETEILFPSFLQSSLVEENRNGKEISISKNKSDEAKRK